MSNPSTSFQVVLASTSPRRRQLLEEAGVPFSVRTPHVDESLTPEEKSAPLQAVKALAGRKAGSVVRELLAQGLTKTTVVIGADTVIVCNDQLFGKPRDKEDAFHMLQTFSGTTHQVHTAVAMWFLDPAEDGQLAIGRRAFMDTAHVTFRLLSEKEISDYLHCGEYTDKAGAYAIQGAGASLIDYVEGDRNTVIGLPVQRLLHELSQLESLDS